MAEEIPQGAHCKTVCVGKFSGEMRQRKKRSVYSRGGSDVGYGICACVGHEDSAGNPCRRTPDGVYGGRYFRGDSACARS